MRNWVETRLSCSTETAIKGNREIGRYTPNAFTR